MCRSTLCHLNNEELHCPIQKELCRVFDVSITHHLGPTAKDTDFPAADLTPEYLTYDDDHDLDPDHGDLEVTPEIGDIYLSAEISIPRGGSIVKGRVKSLKRDIDGLMPTLSLTLLLTIDALTWRYDLLTKRLADLTGVPT